MFNVIHIQDVSDKLGELTKLLRKTQGLTQQELADKLSMSRITIQNLEAGKNTTVDTLLKVMQHFDLLPNFHEFLTKEMTNNSYPSLY